MGLNFGMHLFCGLRYMKKFLYYLEVRPSIQKFELESGSTINASKDKFDLNSKLNSNLELEGIYSNRYLNIKNLTIGENCKHDCR